MGKCHYNGCNRRACFNGMCSFHMDSDAMVSLWQETVEELVIDEPPTMNDTQEIEVHMCAIEDCPNVARVGMYCDHHAPWDHLFSAKR